jgi:hypothetical protein
MWDIFLIISCILALIAVAFIILNIYRTQTNMLRQQEQELHQDKMYLKFMDDSGTSQDQVNSYEQQLFDDAAQLFLEDEISIDDVNQAHRIQAAVLKKMPPRTHSEIRKVGITDWVISWNYYGQSLEYYVRRQGIFYVHVDRLGHEFKKKHEFLEQLNSA